MSRSKLQAFFVILSVIDMVTTCTNLFFFMLHTSVQNFTVATTTCTYGKKKLDFISNLLDSTQANKLQLDKQDVLPCYEEAMQ